MVHRLLITAFILGTTATLAAQSNPSFELKSENLIAQNGGNIVQGDFNKDGKPDFVSGVTLRLGNGDGTFQPPRTIGSLNEGSPLIVDLAAADLNRDGNLDVVLLTNQYLYVFYGNGNGTFQAPKSYTTTENGTSVAVADLNDDGYPDITVGGVQGSIQIFNNAGGNNFVPGNMYSLGSEVIQVRAGDVNANGVIALAALTEQAAFVLWGDGHSNFHAVQLATYGTGTPEDLNVGDLNQDGNADIMVSYNCGTEGPPPSKNPYNCIGVDVFYGQGNQTTFHRVALQDSGVDAGTPWAADINGDGIGDIVSGTCDSNHSQCGLFVWLGHPYGSFDQTPQRYIVSSDSSGFLAPGDFNRDGMIDFVSILGSTGNAEFYLNSSNRAPCATSQINPTVTVCQPVDNSYLVSPVRVQATTYDKTPVTALQEYVDNNLVYSEYVSSFDITLPETPGPHFFVTKAWDARGLSFRSDRHITVFSGTPEPACYVALGAASICLPAGVTSSSPVHILANGYTSAVPTAAQLYIDGNLIVSDQGYCYPNGNCAGGTSYLDTSQNLSSGSHELFFKLWDANGKVYTAEKTVNVD